LSTKNITLADIAKKTGYSANTVSHALRDKPDISQKTKKYISKVAEEMGYIVNAAAGSLRSGKTKNIAIIVGDISNPHFSIMIKEMERRLRRYGYNAFILNTDEDEKLERDAIISAISKKADGILICPVQKTRKNLEFMKQNHIPYVLFGRRFKNDLSSYVVCDDINGGYVAAKHLLDLNHKRILFINPPTYISSSAERLQGIQKAISEYKMDRNCLSVAEIGISGGVKELKKILTQNSSCTGIICFSDMIALQTCHILKELGKSVPDDASIIGFDNIVSKFYLPLMLSSVTSSKTKLSIKSVDTIMSMINNEEDGVCQYVLPTQIIKRESTNKI
jgi:LacI family transcriptional regulator